MSTHHAPPRQTAQPGILPGNTYVGRRAKFQPAAPAWDRMFRVTLPDGTHRNVASLMEADVLADAHGTVAVRVEIPQSVSAAV